MSNHPSAGFLAHQSEDTSRVQTVLEHLEGTAALAEQFARPLGGGEQARLAGMLHDIGKYSEAFQAQTRLALRCGLYYYKSNIPRRSHFPPDAHSSGGTV